MAATEATTATVLLDLAVMTAVSGVLSHVAVRLRQPAVIGEVVAGILLGPTLLGLLPGHLTDLLFPADARPFLLVLANVGLVLFMFGVGFELDFGTMRQGRSSLAVAAVSLGSTLCPLVLGLGVAALIWPAHRGEVGEQATATSFALFVGVAMAVTAFPVLARILAECGLTTSRLGTFTMTCAAGADLIAWSLLALVVVLVDGGGRIELLLRMGGVVLLTVGLVFVVRPALRAMLARRRADPHGAIPLLTVVMGLFLSAWTTTWLGFHPIFGAFAFGAVVPRHELRRAAPDVPVLIEHSNRLLVPIFFVTTGLQVNISDLGVRGLLETLLMITAACSSKFLGAAGGAFLGGLGGRRAAAVGVLMNSHGLTELVVIQVGLSMGVLDTRLASALVVMALVTTVAAMPLFRRLYDGEPQYPDGLRSRKVPSRARTVDADAMSP